MSDRGLDWIRAAGESRRLREINAEMLEALRLMVEWADGEHGDGPVGVQTLTEARAAITKAEGR